MLTCSSSRRQPEESLLSKAVADEPAGGLVMVGALLRKACNFTAALMVGVGVSTGVFAADIVMPTKAPRVTPAPIGDHWTFSLTPYMWATSLSGSTTVKGRTTDIDASFFDILRHTQFPKGLFEVAAFGEARYGRFALLTDFTYMKLGLGASLQRSRDIGRLANLTIGASAGLDVQMIIAEVAAAYEVARWGSANLAGPSTAIDLYAGGRVWWQEADAQLAISGVLTGLGPLGLTRARSGVVSASGSVSWVDPVVGARIRHQFYPGLDLVVSGDVGGFGAASKFSWQAIAALNWQFMKTKYATWSGMIGYKALNVDYSQGSGLTHYEYDMTTYGPIFGITARF